MPHKPILIMAGGTGGHIYPALAVADFLRQQHVPVYWLGTEPGLESRIVPGKDYELRTINVAGLRGNGIIRWLFAPFTLLFAVGQAAMIIRDVKPGAVLGLGGFVSGPGGIAAWLLGIPLFIHEQNSIAGFTNRLLAPFAKIVMQGFPDTFKSGKHIKTTGNPVRRDVIMIPEPQQRMQMRMRENMHVLVIGGSQGARILNEKIPETLRHLQENTKIDIWHQTGEKHFSRTQKNYESVKGTHTIRIEPYIEDMAAAYSWADLVLCRAGALTIAELCVVGIASILVPYPFAVDDHQTENARRLIDKGCAFLLPETEFDIQKLAELLSDLSRTKQRLLDMAKLARELAKPRATEEVGEVCLEAVYV